MWTGSSASSRTRKLAPTHSLCWSCSATAGYWVAQLAGGLVAAAVVGGLVHRAQVPAPTLYGHALLAAVVVEMLFTFALCYVVLNVATSGDCVHELLPHRTHCQKWDAHPEHEYPPLQT